MYTWIALTSSADPAEFEKHILLGFDPKRVVEKLCAGARQHTIAPTPPVTS